MSHTVVRLVNAEVTSEMKAENLSNKIEAELKDRGYETHDVAVGDNTDMDGNILLRAVIDFVYSSEADSFTTYLKKLVENNLVSEGGDEDGFVSAVVDEHECMHLQGESEPCKPVSWSYGA